MRQKLITLAVGALVASLLALPATAAGPGRGNAPKKAIPAACLQAAQDTAKTNREARRAAIKQFHADQKAARAAFRAANPSPTADQLKTFREARKAALKDFLQKQRATAKANHAAQRAAIKACVANS